MRRYNALTVISFIYGGFMILTYTLAVYSMVWGNAFFDFSGVRSPFNSRTPRPVCETCTNNESPANASRDIKPSRNISVSPLAAATSPIPVLVLFSGVLSVANGFALRALTYKGEVEKIKLDLKDKYLTDDEKRVVKALEDNQGEITQKELSDRLDLTRVKTHRIIQKLETKKIIKKVPHGQTNKIIIQEDN